MVEIGSASLRAAETGQSDGKHDSNRIIPGGFVKNLFHGGVSNR